MSNETKAPKAEAARGGPQRLCAAAVIVVAGLAMTGWILGVEPLKSALPGLTAMNPLTALLFIIAGLVLVPLRGQAFILPAGLLLGLMGLFKLLGYASWDPGLDAVMFRQALEAYSPPNRMAPNTALGFLMTGLALAFLGRREPWSPKAGQSLALAATGLSLFAMLGYAYRVPRFYGIGSFMPMALNTAICFALINSAILLARRGEGWMACVSDDGPGGIMARRLLPFTFLIPALAGILRLKGQWDGWYGTETGTAFYAVALIAAFSGLVWYNALLLGRLDLARKRIEERMAKNLKALADFKAALDEHAIVAITDARGKITYVNDKFCAISKYSREELLGRDHRIVNSGHHSKPFIRALWETIADGRVWHDEIKNRAKDGSFYWVDTTIVPFLDEDGKPVQYIAIRTDITERRQNERVLRDYADKLEQSNRELDSFSYSVSHDLRAPLRAIDGFSQVVLEDYAGALDDEGKDRLGRIRQGCQQMGRLIDDLINLSRVIRHELRMEETDLSVIAGSVMEQLKNADRSREVGFTAPPCVLVRGDPGLLRAALENLLGNAWKFTGRKKDAKIEFGVAQNGGETVYSVKDNGAGFDMAYANKLFGAFQRLHSQEEFSGTGIGLATIQRIVRRHGGRVWAEGAVGRGAAFYFTLNSKGGSDGDKRQDDSLDRG